MEIISDPDFTYEEITTVINDVEVGDVFRFIDCSFEDAIKNKKLYMKIQVDNGRNCNLVDLFTGQTLGSINGYNDDFRVIIHTAKLLVIPNT